jgi:hypothetical protein
MATRTNSRRPNVGAPGFKALVTAMSLAVTIGGWAVIAANAQSGGQTANNTLPPMPTLVPTPPPYVAQPNSNPATTGSQTGTGNALNAQTNAAAPRLRSVTIDPNLLPQPMTITRSSR